MHAVRVVSLWSFTTMRTSITSVSNATFSDKRPAASSSNVLMALLIAAVAPAAFWTAVFAGVSNLLGYQPAMAALLTLSLCISLFLGCFIAMLHHRRD